MWGQKRTRLGTPGQQQRLTETLGLRRKKEESCNYQHKIFQKNKLTIMYRIPIESENRKVMEWLGLEGTLETTLSNPCAKAETGSRGLHQGGFECLQGSRLHSPLGSLFQCSVILATQNFSLIFRWNSLCFVCNCCSMLLSLEKVWPHYLYTVSPKTFVALIQYI